MTTLIAIHEIEYLDAKGKLAYAKPGRPFPVSEDNIEKLKTSRAARDPTEGEIALEALRNSKRAGKTAAVPAASEKKTKKPESGNDDVV